MSGNERADRNSDFKLNTHKYINIKQQNTWDETPLNKVYEFARTVKGTPSIPETYLSSSVARGLNLRVG